jgi:hypothetical protein
MSQLNIYDLYKDSLDEINVEERGQLTIDRFNRYANKALKEYIDYLTGRTADEPQPKLGLIRIQKIADLLYPIFSRKMQPYKNGLIPYPEDYDYLLDLRLSGDPNWKAGDCDDNYPKKTIDEILNGQQGFKQVDVLAHNKIPSRVNTHIPLLKKKPCAEQYQDGFSAYNCETSGSAFICYLKEVIPIELKMTQDPSTHMLTFDNTSISPPVSKKSSPWISRKIADYFFQFTREGEGLSFTEENAKTQ